MAQAEDKNLPSLDDYIIEDEFPSVEEAVDTDLPSIEDNKESNLPSIEEEVEGDLPSVDDYVEKEEEELVEEVIVEEDLTLDEVKELIEEVKAEILDIPQIKHFDEVLEKLCEAVDQVKSEIPEVPEPKVYDDEIEAICDAIDSVKENISSLPEVKYYDEQVQNIEDRIDSVIQEVANLPEPKYYDTDLDSIKEDITKVREELAPLPWVENTFSGIEENFEKVSDVIDTLKEKLNFNFDEYSDSIDVKFFESKVETQGIKEEFESEKEKIWDELKKSSVKIFEYQKTFKDDDRKLKKQILGEYNKLKNNIKKELEEATDKSIKTDELLLGYFTELKGEISNLPEVKYYDEEIDELQKLVSKFNKRFSPVEGDIKSLYRIVEDIKKTQIELNEQILDEPADVSQDVGGGKDPLTPTDQKFATLDDLSKHYTLFVNRIQQQLSTVGGGGAGFIKDLADVDISGLQNNYILQWNASENKWETVANTGGGGTGSITIKDEGSVVGTANSVTSIDFVGGNIVANATGTGATITFSDTPEFDSLKVTGLSTFSGAVTLESTNYLQLKDSTNIIGHNGVNNLFRFTDTLQFRGDTLFFQEYDGTEYMRLSEQFGVQIKHQGSTKLQIESDGITVTGTINDHTIPSGSGTFALTSDVPTNNNQLTNGAGYITTSFTNTNQLTNGAGFVTFTNTNQLTNGAGFVTFTNNNQLINGAGYITTSFTNTNQLTNGAGFVTFTNNNQLINGAGFVTFTNNNQLINGAGFVTFTNNNQLINGAGFVTFTNNNQLINGAGYITTSFTNTNQLTNGAGFVTFTNNNQLINGAGFITASDSITGTSAGLSGSPNITVSAVTATSGEFSGNVTIGGTLTYQDVTNVDSLGIITARSDVIVGGGLSVTGISTFNGDVNFSSDITANGNIVGDNFTNISGINSVTATSFHGDGSGLTGVASTDNIITSTSSTFANINSTGIVTATSFVGDGSGLTGVASTDFIVTGTAATFNNVVNVGTGITLDATSGIITATNFFGYSQGQVSYITATETLTNKTLRNPTFESGANSPEFLETRYVNATQQDFVQLYTGGSSGTYFTQGEYQKIATITPSGNHQNYTFNIRITATSASNYQIVNFTGGLRANTLPDLDFTVNFSEEHNGVRFIEPKLWTKETTTAGFILAFEYVHSSSLFGGVNVEATIIPRSSAQRANVVFNTTQDSEQSSIDTGFTERDPTLTVSTVNGVPIFGTEFKIEGSTDDGFETTITTVDATADRTITFPDSSGTVALLGDGVMSDLADDTTPQLGGNLDLNSKDITGTGNINVSGITTISTGIGTVHIGTGSTTLLVDGDARVTGILTIGQGSITLDPNAKKISGIDEIIVGTATTVSIKQNNQGNITFEKEDGEEASVGIGTTVSINTTGIITAATLKASTAFYPPIYTTAQRDAGSFNEGAMIYNSTTKKMEFYDGTSWNSLPGMSLGLTVALDG